jgi:hypothetical protein
VSPLIDDLKKTIEDNGYDEITADALVGPPPDSTASVDHRLMRLVWIATLWDYVDPFGLDGQPKDA